MPAQNWVLWALEASLFRSFSSVRKKTKNFLLPILFQPKKWRWGDSHPRPNILSAKALQVQLCLVNRALNTERQERGLFRLAYAREDETRRPCGISHNDRDLSACEKHRKHGGTKSQPKQHCCCYLFLCPYFSRPGQPALAPRQQQIPVESITPP